ncbi:immunity protein Imm33 domain-containing protein [Prosthecobacter debontii]|uniref:immunity protein Imm33 domain-containing protein n=1 Tax=Prosthecobacter debontii TaxID=48467 RepID=UPI00099B0E64
MFISVNRSAQSCPQAAIICSHAATKKHPILQAFHTEHSGETDSGWQFFCGVANEERVEDVQVWSLDEVLQMEPSLREFMNVTEGMTVWRSSVDMPWQVCRT